MNFNQPERVKSSRLKILGAVLTVFGLGLFAYFVYEAGFDEIWGGIGRLGWGFFVILGLYGVKLATRVAAWTMCVEPPHKLTFVEGFKAVVIGEALTVIIPLGILVSGTAKAISVRRQMPLVVGLSSIAIENLFYSLATAILVLGGSISFLLLFNLSENVATINYALIALVTLLIVGGILMIVYQWRFASALAEWLYGRGLATKILDAGRAEVRRFEDLIYGFYRRNSRKFLPVMLLETTFHACGILEVWFILQAISDVAPTFLTAFLLETINRVILVVFKLVPFLLGVDEAGASFITESLAIGASVGVTLAIIRKGRVLVWTALGMLLVARSGLSWKEITTAVAETQGAKA